MLFYITCRQQVQQPIARPIPLPLFRTPRLPKATFIAVCCMCVASGYATNSRVFGLLSRVQRPRVHHCRMLLAARDRPLTVDS
ncbi:hypothetical protein [Microcoleus sp. bin38.metabat.b11b12b14.051]|uniref:hypothetical protein n=1 Tax=Microcoleus sp. bin38.metabat.b11b12b14.051 TaxID=2742709 RepID=UPI0025E62EED|nr:hypothetical protein [Microcoleus sp. bin38.metabat.b11b12b14.051]